MDGTLNALKIEYKLTVPSGEFFNKEQRMPYGYKSCGNKGTKRSQKGPRGASGTKISIIPIKMCTQNLLDNKIQLQSQPAQAFMLDLIRRTCESRCSVAKLILRMLISSFSFTFFFFHLVLQLFPLPCKFSLLDLYFCSVLLLCLLAHRNQILIEPRYMAQEAVQCYDIKIKQKKVVAYVLFFFYFFPAS